MWQVIVNPEAGTGAAELAWQAQQLALEAEGFAFERVPVAQADDVAKVVAARIEAEQRRWVVVGGDGTFHHVVNGVMQQTACASHEVTLAFWSLGSGNDWVREHGLPRQAEAWRKMFLAQQTQRQDVALIEAQTEQGAPLRRYCVNVVGLGYDAFVARYLKENQVSNTGGLKYFASIFACLRQYQAQPLRVSTPSESWEVAFYTLNAGICRYNGGGMRFVPHADPRDGLLALSMLPDIPPWRVVINLPWLYTAWFDRHPLVTARQAAWVRYEHLGEQPVLLEADGEFLGTTPARVSVVPGALRFVAEGDGPQVA